MNVAPITQVTPAASKQAISSRENTKPNGVDLKALHAPVDTYGVFSFVGDEISAIVKASMFKLMTKFIGIE